MRRIATPNQSTEESVQSVIAVVTLPLLLLNTLGGIVSLIFLAFLGEWSVIGYGILFIVAMPWLFALAQLPSMLPTLAGAWLYKRNWRLPAIGCVFLASLWTSALIVVWCSIMAYKYVHLVTEGNRIPILLWGYTVALAPLDYMANHERDNVFTGLQTLLAQVLFIALIVCWAVDAAPTAYIVFGAIGLLTFPLLSLALGAAEMAFRRRDPEGSALIEMQTAWIIFRRTLDSAIRSLDTAQRALESQQLPVAHRALLAARGAFGSELPRAVRRTRYAFQSALKSVGILSSRQVLDVLASLHRARSAADFTAAGRALAASGQDFANEGAASSAHPALSYALDTLAVLESMLAALGAVQRAVERNDETALDSARRALETEARFADEIHLR